MFEPESLLELIRRAATDLPQDVEDALRKAAKLEDQPAARFALESIIKNIALARQMDTPMCQDTGTPIFYIDHPYGSSTLQMRETIHAALREATRRGYLRPNAVHAISGENNGDNIGGDHFPLIHFKEWDQPQLSIALMLKGGGSENVGAQYSLPDRMLGAGRDLEGVRRVVLDAVHKAQGKGCPPGIVGVGIGGDRATSYLIAKKALLRSLDEANPDPQLDEFERKLGAQINELGIGPMGFGGKTTVLGVKVDAGYRLPASYFVSISTMCWACRRWRMTVRDGEVSYAS